MKGFVFRLKQKAVSFARIGLNAASGGVKCVVCGKYSFRFCVCPECRNRYFSVKEAGRNVCRICGKSLISEKEICLECREKPVLVHTDGVFPLFSYRLWNTTLLCRWKLENDRSLSEFFSELAAERLRQLEEKNQGLVLVPVPPRPGKIKEKGWDQIKELCDFLKYRYGFKTADYLVRNSTVQQKTLGREGRIETIGSAYSLNEAEKSFSAGSVCIVDDVITTGSTIECCARLLKGAGIKKVFAVSLFQVDS